MTAPTPIELPVVLAGPDGKVLDKFLPDSLMSQAELNALLSEIKKPTGGWAATDLTTAVQAQLSKADTALQSAPVSSVAGRTGAVVLTATDINNSTSVGRSVLTAASAAAARTAIGAGVSNLQLGTAAGTAAEGNHTHPYSSLTGIPTTFTPSAHTHEVSHVNNLQNQLDGINAKVDNHSHTSTAITDATAVGRSVLTAVDAASARTALGAGTSSLTIGTTASTAKAGNWTPAAANISDATATGRAVLTATDPAAARTAIGATDLTIGATSTTAKAGDWFPSWGEVAGKPTTFAPAAHTHTAADISNATTVGRSVLTATDAAAARTAIGAGTSNLQLGTTGTTAAAGNDTRIVNAVQTNDSRLTDQRVPTDGSVTSVKIADGAVGGVKLGDNSVSNGKIVNGAVTDAKVSASAAIALSKLATGKVLGYVNNTPTDLDVRRVTEAQYAAASQADRDNANIVWLVFP